ncbi:active regulator of SIRT1 isoform X1 [Ischnura elegans]|uniref:active regulator of SIRT1 isoform X1 n=1 Tax=Ischnura elegans TaxID=197161 RepID=UPI001ED8854F|nr:active regulator of SIRT1 isoform X1 [Ischnura elegans]
MSTSVLKRALELFKEDESINKGVDGEDANELKKRKKPKLIKDAGKKKKSVSSWQTAADIRRRLQPSDRTSDNLQALILLNSTSVDKDVASKIMSRASRRNFVKTEEVKEENTVFTEEDFEKFEKEYFVSD